jgi:hypothetical protein
VIEVLIRLRIGIPPIFDQSATTTTDNQPTSCPPC